MTVTFNIKEDSNSDMDQDDSDKERDEGSASQQQRYTYQPTLSSKSRDRNDKNDNSWLVDIRNEKDWNKFLNSKVENISFRFYCRQNNV